MGYMTAEQAIEAARGLTFEKVWAALMESRQRMEESDRAMKADIAAFQKSLDASNERAEKANAEFKERTEKSNAEFKKNMDDSHARMEKTVADLSKNIGGLNNKQGRLTAAMFSVELWKKFADLGFGFTRQSPNVEYYKDSRLLAEVDLFLENGDYAMIVEIKTDLRRDDVDEHTERIAKIRAYMDARGDHRKLVGAVAGEIITKEVAQYAHRQGFYVVAQSGDSVAVAAAPQGFAPREW